MAEKSDIVSKLTSVGVCEEFKQTKKLKDIEIDRVYKIIRLREIKTKFGRAIIAELEDFQVFLPTRFAADVSHDEVENINREGDIALISRGPMETCGENGTTKLEFRKLYEQETQDYI